MWRETHILFILFHFDKCSKSMAQYNDACSFICIILLARLLPILCGKSFQIWHDFQTFEANSFISATIISTIDPTVLYQFHLWRRIMRSAWCKTCLVYFRALFSTDHGIWYYGEPVSSKDSLINIILRNVYMIETTHDLVISSLGFNILCLQTGFYLIKINWLTFAHGF